ncbi:hypothetical protein MMC07_001699 [Pseudocyphellaria aurata]|nr:hypothetical protein [Pseudocyphellaria aurata]
MSPNPRGNNVMYWTIVLGVIDTLAVALRFLARKRSGTKIATDDWMIMASLVPAYWVTKEGAGKHERDLTLSEKILLLKYMTLGLITYGLTITAVKISILSLYRRVFNTVPLKKVTLVVGFLCVTWLCGDVFSTIFFCSPISAAWDPELVFTNHCRDFQAFLLGITISNLLLDVIILCMPLPMIWSLKLSTSKKLEISGIFLLGSFTCIASLIRIVTIGNIREQDFAYSSQTPYLWSHLEPATAIWCACLVTYRPLFRDLCSRFQRIFGSSKQNFLNRKKCLNRNRSGTNDGSNSDAPPWVGRDLCVNDSAKYLKVSVRAAKGDLHVVNFYVKPSSPERLDSSPADEYGSSRIAADREASMV